MLSFVRDAFVRERNLPFSVAQERDIIICSGQVCAGTGFHIFSLDHVIIPNRAQNPGNNPRNAVKMSIPQLVTYLGISNTYSRYNVRVYTRYFVYRIYYVPFFFFFSGTLLLFYSGHRFFIAFLAAGHARGPCVHRDASVGPGRAPWRVFWAFKVGLLEPNRSLETPTVNFSHWCCAAVAEVLHNPQHASNTIY